jgi:hypothetical protein
VPVFYRYGIKILYIHIPKTGGTAIEMFFEKNGFGIAYLDRGSNFGNLNPTRRCSPQHMEAAILSKVFRLSSFDYIFMTVRHPITRILSEYKMRVAEKIDLPDVNTWVRRFLRRYGDDPYMMDNHIRPQVDFWVEHADVFRQEDGFGPDWIEQIAGRIPCKLQQRNTEIAMRFDVKAADQSDLSGASAAALRRFYEPDYLLFGYS